MAVGHCRKEMKTAKHKGLRSRYDAYARERDSLIDDIQNPLKLENVSAEFWIVKAEHPIDSVCPSALLAAATAPSLVQYVAGIWSIARRTDPSLAFDYEVRLIQTCAAHPCCALLLESCHRA